MRRRVAILLMILAVGVSAFAQRPKVGLVLCGGGAKGAAHVGVLKVLEENNIPIDMIVGTSMGAIVGGFYSVGYSPAELDTMIMSQDWDNVMSGSITRKNTTYEKKKQDDRLLVKVPFGIDVFEEISVDHGRHDDDALAPEVYGFKGIPGALMGGQNVFNLLTNYTIGYHDNVDFSKLPIPFACVAVDLVSYKEIVIRSGNLARAMRASMSLPGIFAPVRIDNMVLVDGGVKNNYPVDVCREMGADIVIGVKLGYNDPIEREYDNIGDIFDALMDAVMSDKFDSAVANTDIFITPSVVGYGTMSFDTQSLRTLIDRGEAAAREHTDEIVKLRELLTRSEQEAEQNFVGPKPMVTQAHEAVRLTDSLMISAIHCRGISEADAAHLLRRTSLKTGVMISGVEIDKAIAALYATNAYAAVTYSLSGTSSPYEMTINFVPKRNHQIGLGARFDTEEIASLLVDLRLNNQKLYGSRLGISGRLSANYRLNVDYSYLSRGIFQFNAGYGLRKSNFGILPYGMAAGSVSSGRTTNLNMTQNFLYASVSTGSMRSFKIDIGARYDNFQYNSEIAIPAVPDIYNKDDGLHNFLSVNFSADVDRFDNSYFPTKGFVFSSTLSARQGLEDDSYPFGDLSLYAKWAISPVDGLTLLPFARSRVLMGNRTPIAYMNVLGGYESGRYLEQQMPFYGVMPATPMSNLLAVAGVDARMRLAMHHYIYAGMNCVSEGLDAVDYTGLRLGYAFESRFGPIGFNMHWSDLTNKVGAYVSVGYWF